MTVRRYIQHPVTLELIPAEQYYRPTEHTHLVMPDLPGYESPIDGTWIEGRKARREDLAKHDCVPYEPGMVEHQQRVMAENQRAAEARLCESVDRLAAQLTASNLRDAESRLPEHLRSRDVRINWD